MNDARIEAFLARLYVDDLARARFLRDPGGEAAAAGIGAADRARLGLIDRAGLELAALSFGRKRAGKLHGRRTGARRLLSRIARR
ncbi:MAG TPA: hypothetical protein VGR87_15525 [Candidatus Limnocylindria bacterium]|nr:hypothetical protein [Candidatus Limnocylindria bacterium]